jgi:glutaredoxin
MATELLVYFRPGCPFAAKLRLKLRVASMPYRAIRFGQDPAADAAVRDVNDGNEVSPTVRVGDRYLTNPTVRQIRQVQRAFSLAEPHSRQ